ncbi:hypothetical protein DB891_10175 [Flavobacterium laiguense]|uniref:Transglutaminase-like domain-containing protein n=1 Tax=Flavobacterium laiguense TaxID=2169409 RepID=A0A2U1JW12_9FLAO|nr:hypothetical protein DB891_10175 [Flavobacterium laiguense]
MTNWDDVLLHVKNIPYGRNSNREDLSLVLKENKGSCSSKHAFLKEIASQNNIPNVQLIIGIYKMKESNTKIGTILSENTIYYIPEAHCYLNINGERLDYTTGSSNFEKIKNDLLEEIEIEPYQVGEFKIKYHQDFIKKWLSDSNATITFDQLWAVREQCIAYLSI